MEAAFKLFDSLREVGARHDPFPKGEGGEGEEVGEVGDDFAKVARLKANYEREQQALNEKLRSLEDDAADGPAVTSANGQQSKSPEQAVAVQRLVEERDRLRAELAIKTVKLREMIAKLQGLDHDLTLLSKPNNPLAEPPSPLYKPK